MRARRGGRGRGRGRGRVEGIVADGGDGGEYVVVVVRVTEIQWQRLGEFHAFEGGGDGGCEGGAGGGGEHGEGVLALRGRVRRASTATVGPSGVVAGAASLRIGERHAASVGDALQAVDHLALPRATRDGDGLERVRGFARVRVLVRRRRGDAGLGRADSGARIRARDARRGGVVGRQPLSRGEGEVTKATRESHRLHRPARVPLEVVVQAVRRLDHLLLDGSPHLPVLHGALELADDGGDARVVERENARDHARVAGRRHRPRRAIVASERSAPAPVSARIQTGIDTAVAARFVCATSRSFENTRPPFNQTDMHYGKSSRKLLRLTTLGSTK